MPGSLFDLSDATTIVPESMLIDSNVVAARFMVAYQARERANAARTASFFQHAIAPRRHLVLSPTAYSEVLHTALRRRYQRELLVHRDAVLARYGRRITSWSELYKRDATLLQTQIPELNQLRPRMVQYGVVIVAPDELGPIPSGRPYDQELIHLIGRYGLDTNDALILMEASRLGISSIVTMDRDMQRALPDFDVYTWE